MARKAQYKTKQRDELLTFLESVTGQHITAAEICDHFKTNEKSVSMTTIYRHLEKMVSEGLVKKYVIDSNCPACFEYVGLQDEHEGESCYHCKCEACGKLIHLHCDEMQSMEMHISDHHGFVLNPIRTVFYGLCESCSKNM